MNATPSPSCYIPHDGVSGYGLTTLSVTDHHAVDALNAHTLRRPAHLVDEPVEWPLFWHLGGAVGLRIQLFQDLGGVDVALPDRGDEMIQVLQVERFGHLQQIGVFGLRQPTPLDLTIEDLASEFDGRRVLFDAQPLPNLVARAPGADMREPIATRLC